MRVPFVLLLVCLAFAGGFRALNGLILTLPLAVSLIAALAAVILLGNALWRSVRGVRAPQETGQQVILDGSNVMHWNGETPRLATLRDVIAECRIQGHEPGVIFDANAGYLLADRYLDDRHFAKLLDLPDDRVVVVGKGEPADPTILAAARELGAKVVTNDRYRDWAAEYPEVATAGHLIRGGFRDGNLWIDKAVITA